MRWLGAVPGQQTTCRGFDSRTEHFFLCTYHNLLFYSRLVVMWRRCVGMRNGMFVNAPSTNETILVWAKFIKEKTKWIWINPFLSGSCSAARMLRLQVVPYLYLFIRWVTKYNNMSAWMFNNSNKYSCVNFVVTTTLKYRYFVGVMPIKC